jgi:hypothetical protein
MSMPRKHPAEGANKDAANSIEPRRRAGLPLKRGDDLHIAHGEAAAIIAQDEAEAD